MKTGNVSEPINALRAFIRRQLPASYVWAAICTDGELLCEKCVRDNARLILRATRTGDDATLDWQVDGVTHSGDAETDGECVHCGSKLWSVESESPNASREEQNARLIDCGPNNWDDNDSED